MALLGAVLLAPALGMYVVEPSGHRRAARAMLLMGVASAVMPVRLLWGRGGTLDAALDQMADPACPLLSWASCAAGWLTSQVAEVVTRLLTAYRNQHAVRDLQKEREQLLENWPVLKRGAS